MEGWGANGVDIFFVISGFVMVYAQSINKKGCGRFLLDRVIRVVPIYWLLTFLMLGLYFLFPWIFRGFEPTSGLIISSLLFVSNLMVDQNPVIGVGWTLEWEMLFYLIFGISLGFKNVLMGKSFVPLFLLFLALFFDAKLILEFLFGMAVAEIHMSKKVTFNASKLFLVLGVFLLGLSIFIKPDLEEIDRVWIWGIPSFFLVLGCVGIRQTNSPILLLLGNASYSIYLIQHFAVPAFYKGSSKLLGFVQADILGLTCLIFTGLLGVLMYLVIEKPLTRYLRRLNTRSPHSLGS